MMRRTSFGCASPAPGGKSKSSGRRVNVVPALITALAGLVFGVASKEYDLAKHYGIEGRNQVCVHSIRIFGSIFHEESGAAVEQQEAGRTITGPAHDLET